MTFEVQPRTENQRKLLEQRKLRQQAGELDRPIEFVVWREYEDGNRVVTISLPRVKFLEDNLER